MSRSSTPSTMRSRRSGMRSGTPSGGVRRAPSRSRTTRTGRRLPGRSRGSSSRTHGAGTGWVGADEAKLLLEPYGLMPVGMRADNPLEAWEAGREVRLPGRAQGCRPEHRAQDRPRPGAGRPSVGGRGRRCPGRLRRRARLRGRARPGPARGRGRRDRSGRRSRPRFRPARHGGCGRDRDRHPRGPSVPAPALQPAGTPHGRSGPCGSGRSWTATEAPSPSTPTASSSCWWRWASSRSTPPSWPSSTSTR